MGGPQPCSRDGCDGVVHYIRCQIPLQAQYKTAGTEGAVLCHPCFRSTVQVPMTAIQQVFQLYRPSRWRGLSHTVFVLMALLDFVAHKFEGHCQRHFL